MLTLRALLAKKDTITMMMVPFTMPASRNAKGKQRIPKLKDMRKTRVAALLTLSALHGSNVSEGVHTTCTCRNHSATYGSTSAIYFSTLENAVEVVYLSSRGIRNPVQPAWKVCPGKDTNAVIFRRPDRAASIVCP